MKSALPLIIRLVLCVCLVGCASLAALTMSNGLYQYRSPLAENPPAPGDPLGPQVTRRMIIVLVDGLRYDTSMNAELMPNLDGLRRAGASAKMASRAPSYSQPGYTTLFTGAWPDINDSAAFNLEYGELRAWTQDNLFSAAARRGLTTAAAGYHWLERLIPSPALSTGAFVTTEEAESDEASVRAALPWLKQPEEYPFVLIHLMQVDHAGHHLGGPRSPAWAAAASQVDELVGQILTYVDLSQDTVLVVSDHGQVAEGGHGGQDLAAITEPFIIAGRGVRPGEYDTMHMVDVAPTVSALMGFGLPASGQGRALTDLLDLPDETLSNLPAAETRQQERLYNAYSAAVMPKLNLLPARRKSSSVKLARLESPKWVNLLRLVGGYSERADQPAAPLDAAAWRMETRLAKESRLLLERAARAVIAVPALAAAALALLWLREPGKGWRFVSALVYLALFNLRYALVDRRTYSFSSTSTLGDFALYVLLVSGAAYLAAWGLWAWKARLFHARSPIEAARRTLNMTAVILFFAGLPALANFVINGLGVGWTLPDMRLLFWGWLGSLHIAVLGLLGLVFSAVSALAVWLREANPRLDWLLDLLRSAVRVEN